MKSFIDPKRIAKVCLCVLVASAWACTGGHAQGEPAVSDSVQLALLEACQQTDATTTGEYVVSPGQVVVDESGTQVVHASGEVVSGETSGLVGVGVALEGVNAGDAGIARDDTMDIEFSPIELQGPGEWPLVVVYDRSIESEIVVTERDKTRQFMLHVSSDCGEGPGMD